MIIRVYISLLSISSHVHVGKLLAEKYHINFQVEDHPDTLDIWLKELYNACYNLVQCSHAPCMRKYLIIRGLSATSR